MTRKVVVIIHGAGDQPCSYPKAEVDALTAALGYQPAYLSARYDDIIATGATTNRWASLRRRCADAPDPIRRHPAALQPGHPAAEPSEPTA